MVLLDKVQAAGRRGPSRYDRPYIPVVSCRVTVGAMAGIFCYGTSWHAGPIPFMTAKTLEGDGMLRQFAKFQTMVAKLDDERGATSVEYALMVTFIAVAIIVAVKAFSSSLLNLFNRSASSI